MLRFFICFTLHQVAPSWCLLSRKCLSRNLPGISQASAVTLPGVPGDRLNRDPGHKSEDQSENDGLEISPLYWWIWWRYTIRMALTINKIVLMMTTEHLTVLTMTTTVWTMTTELSTVLIIITRLLGILAKVTMVRKDLMTTPGGSGRWRRRTEGLNDDHGP